MRRRVLVDRSCCPTLLRVLCWKRNVWTRKRSIRFILYLNLLLATLDNRVFYELYLHDDSWWYCNRSAIDCVEGLSDSLSDQEFEEGSDDTFNKESDEEARDLQGQRSPHFWFVRPYVDKTRGTFFGLVFWSPGKDLKEKGWYKRSGMFMWLVKDCKDVSRAFSTGDC
jgi:hypothetical protein